MIIDNLIKRILKEATTDSGSRGSYVPPLQAGMRNFDKSKLAPFTNSVSNYKSPLVAYDSYDHDWDLRSGQIRELEKLAKKVTNFIKNHPESTNSDEDGNIINQTPGKNKKIVPIKEANSVTTAGEYSGPIELGMKKWKNELYPFSEFVNTTINKKKVKSTTKKNIRKIVGKWEKKDGSYDVDTHPTHSVKEKQINEDLAVWFGKKKKPKGSSQPKGPWVDICRKVDGKHPPCGRKDADSGSYPKCRAAGVAGKMSDSEKRSACQQKRRAEKNDPQSGKGQKPVMVSHKKKTNESMKKNIITLTESDLYRIVKRVLKEEELTINTKDIKDTKNVNDDIFRGIELKCFKIDLKNPKNTTSEVYGPYPWDLVNYDKEARPIRINLKRDSSIPSDVVHGGEYEMTIGFEEITSPKLKNLLTDKKYVITTYQAPGTVGKQYCKVHKEYDQEWNDNLFKMGNNANVIDTQTKLN